MFKKLIVVAAMAMLSIGAQVGTASADLVNGGFETGDFNGWTLTNIDSNNINDFAYVVGGDLSSTAHSGPGTYEALLGKTGGVGTISQAFDTTAGQEYKVSFWLANDMPGTNLFQAVWNNNVIQATALSNVNAFGYSEYQFTSFASDITSTLAFNFQNDPSVFHLDDVSATPTPIPAAFWLLGSGLMGLVGLRRRKE